MMRRSAVAFAVLLVASTVGAQSSTPAASAASTSGSPAPPDTLPAFDRPNGALLRAGSFVYRLTLRRDTVTRDLGTRAVDVTETNVAGVSGWLIAESRIGTPVPTTDSLYLTRFDLSPTRWVAANGAARLAASFTRDSMYGAMQSYQGRASFVTTLPAGALLTAGMVDRIVELLPLQAGYRTGASLVLVELGTPRGVPAELLVERDDTVSLPDGKRADCWVVRVTGAALQERLWVSKEAPRVVKTEQDTPSGVLTALLQPAPVVVQLPTLADLFPGGEPIIVPGSRPIYLPADQPPAAPVAPARPTPPTRAQPARPR